MRRRLRLGIIGGGFVANFHTAAAASVRDLDICAVYALKGADTLAEKARTLGVGDPKVVSSIKDLCGEVDAVMVCVPNYTRVDVIREVVEHGRNLAGIACEKPLARNMVEARQLVELTRGINTYYLENQNEMLAVDRARQQLAAVEARMGAPSLVETAEKHGGPHEGWFWDPTRQGGGVFLDMGCHSVAIGEILATPQGEQPGFLQLESVQATMELLKWGKPAWRAKLLKDRGVDSNKTPAEDTALVTYTFRNPKTKEKVIVVAADSWCYEAPGLLLSMKAQGVGYSLDIDTLRSPSSIFISDAAAASVVNAETMLEKATVTRGQLVVAPNEPCLYGYIGEQRQMVDAFTNGRDGKYNFTYGLRITEMVMAAYMAHERGVKLPFNATTRTELATFIPLIQQGKGREVLDVQD